MNQPELYRHYSMEEALALLGSDEGCQPLCGGHWVILPPQFSASLKSATLGCSRTSRQGSRFHWVADQAYEVSEGQFGFLPSVVTGQSQDTRPIHLFIRPPEAHEFTFAGWLSNSHVRGIGGEHPFGIADFTLSPTLPSTLWCSIGGLSVPGNEDVDIDQVIESLASPQSSQSRFSILEQLINYWHGPCQREDAYSDEELAGHCIPLPLRRWYRHGGKRGASGRAKHLDRSREVEGWGRRAAAFLCGESRGLPLVHHRPRG